MTTTTHTDNIVIGAGEVYIDVLDAEGNTTGERYLGDTTGMQLSTTEERTTVFSGDGPVARKMVDALTSRSFSAQVTMRDMSMENWALFLGGETDDETDADAAVTDEAITVSPDRWYQLGTSASKPMGYLAVKSDPKPVVTNDAGDTTYDAGDDYLVDHASGRLYIVPGGDIAAGTKIKVDYTPESGKHERAQTAASPQQTHAAVRYKEKPTQGKGRDVYIRRCTVGASGDVQLKDGQRGQEQQLALSLGIEQPGDGHEAVIIDGKAA